MKDLIKKMSEYIPEFIDTKCEVSHRIWDVVSKCNSLLISLLTDKILSESTVIKITEIFSEKLDNDLIDDEMYNNICVYYYGLIVYIEDMAMSLEEYEILNNIKIFRDVYFDRIIVFDEDIKKEDDEDGEF